MNDIRPKGLTPYFVNLDNHGSLILDGFYQNLYRPIGLAQGFLSVPVLLKTHAYEQNYEPMKLGCK